MMATRKIPSAGESDKIPMQRLEPPPRQERVPQPLRREPPPTTKRPSAASEWTRGSRGR
jgi:hypothetical protein